ncbi:M36 family metallopeptidase [Alkalisalibacterium limincola]|uniref:Metalloprotease n=1 Tax=Alkalisalibacterium limincola TaxID=2699169 RepID=A0A5C8KKH4_9GAMM|nr:M36 family metallopeptidase [Alkalisalibacterium limincola]TXK59711.1 hypothetical protein FU658_13080 [Alkalisalibacterium limincola]
MTLGNSRRLLLAGAIALALGSATFATATAGSAGVAAERAAVEHLTRQHRALGMARADITEASVASSFTSAHNGVSHVYLQQHHRGIEVRGGVFNVSVAANGEVLHHGHRFVPGLAASAARQTARLDASAALSRVASDALQLQLAAQPRVLQAATGRNQRTVLADAGLAVKPIEAKLVWFVQPSGGVRLAWELEIEEHDGVHWWQAVVDAQTGTTLEMFNLVVQENAEAIALGIARPGVTDAPGDHGHGSIVAHRHHDHVGPQQASSPYGFEPTDGASYNVFPMPLESPSDGPRQLVTDVADPLGSRLGWHDTGANQYTVTRGNNVHAYADRSASNTPDPGSDPDGGPGLVFDFPLDLGAAPVDSQAAIVTNLFYWNNIMHDVSYRYGFTEAAGNFQVNNFGLGGAGNDDVRAEAQDGGGTNNANFGTPTDGQRPRMQMYEWTNPLAIVLDVTGSAAAGQYPGSGAAFGPQLSATGPVGGTVVLADDGTALPHEGCSAFTVPAGSVALVDRGNCPFTQKVANAQAGGASAVIVANNVTGAPISMGGTDASITIPSMMIRLEAGQLLRANLPATGTLSDASAGIPNRDSDLDAGVIAHEYGHGISNRLTGGRTNVGCLNNAEQMGEGWSDWFGIVLTAHPDDTRDTVRGVGTYVTFQPVEGRGIRPTPYSTDMAVNPSTYGWVADPAISQPHGIGYVWNTMLWEMYWNLIDKHGFNPDIYGDWDSGGNNLAMQLVMDGMKFQTCSPGFVDGRDAILAADVALGGDNQCEIWSAFAKRGLGVSASQGSSNNRSDGVEAFDLPAECTLSSEFGSFLAPWRDDIRNRIRAGQVLDIGFTVDGPNEGLLVDSQPINCNTRASLGATQLIATSDDGIEAVGEALQVEWTTDASWRGSCRRVTVRVPGGNDGTLDFMVF